VLAAASTTTVDCRFADVELVDPERFIGTLPAKFGALCDSPCGASVLGAAAVATGVSGVAAFFLGAGRAGCSLSDAAAGCLGGDAAAGGLAGAAGATAAGTPVWVGVAPADAVVSLLDGVELVCAPPDLCTTPDEEPAAEADEFVDDLGSVDDVLAADSDDEPEADELSVGWDVVDVDGFGGAAVAVALTVSDA